MRAPSHSHQNIADHSGQIRHEFKYVVPASGLSELRDFVAPFCAPDAAASGDPPQYSVTTLQLDTQSKALHYAKERENLNRFKLRARTYGDPGSSPEFLEVKRKLETMILKTRCRLDGGGFNRDFVLGESAPKGLSEKSEKYYWEFVRLVKQLDARPSLLIRYIRESWVGKSNTDYRITFDRRLEYSPCGEWTLENNRAWRPMDTGTAFQLPYPPMIVEMKSPKQIPEWMLRVARFFSLQRVGFCKYSTAMRLESLFEGSAYSAASENTSYN